MKTLAVICPVYNEEEVIEAFYHALSSVLIQIKDRYQTQIIFVVDRSQDNTLSILKHIAQADCSISIIALSARFGHQMSLLAGMDHCEADVVIMMDSDLQHPPELIPELIKHYEGGYDIVYTIRNDSPEIGFLKQVSSKLFYQLINYISDIPINESAA